MIDNKKKLKYSICCTPEENCTGELMLMFDSGGLFTTDSKKGEQPFMRVHIDSKSSSACTKAYYCSE